MQLVFQFSSQDYLEEITHTSTTSPTVSDLLGTFNVGYIIFAIRIIVNAHVTRKFEAEGSLEFLTDWLKRIPKKTGIEEGDTDEITAPGDLDNESRHKLISGLH